MTTARLKVRVIPNAAKTEFAGFREEEIVLRLTAPAIEGKANKAAIDFVSRFFSVQRSAITLVAGEKSRHKIFEIIGLDFRDMEKKLSAIDRRTPGAAGPSFV